jgi:hypothetical protein
MKKIRTSDHSPRQARVIGDKRRARRYTAVSHWQEYKVNLGKVRLLTVEEVAALVGDSTSTEEVTHGIEDQVITP